MSTERKTCRSPQDTGADRSQKHRHQKHRASQPCYCVCAWDAQCIGDQAHLLGLEDAAGFGAEASKVWLPAMKALTSEAT